jgi:hypothetical protein
MADPGGPFLNAALACERVLNEQDGVVSAIRIIDRVVFLLDDEGELIQTRHPFTFLVSFKAGAARGSFTVSLRMEKPSGEEVPLLDAPVFFEGEDRGVNLVLQSMFEPEEAGLYWFDVLFEGERVTRVPLRAVYQSQPTTGPAE